jgi:hypothetical protein
VVRCLVPSVLGILMLGGLLLALPLGPLALAGWLLAWSHVLLSRLRYTRFGEQVTGCSFPAEGYLRLPGYILADLVVWASVLFQYPSHPVRSRG